MFSFHGSIVFCIVSFSVLYICEERGDSVDLPLQEGLDRNLTGSRHEYKTKMDQALYSQYEQ